MATKNRDVHSLMIPTIESHILLPNSNVAEILPFNNVELYAEEDGKPAWFLGSLLWRGKNIPLISVDILQGEEDAQANKRARIAVVHTLNMNRDLPYVAIVVQGIPRLSHITPENIKLVVEEALSDAEKMRVTVDDVSASIPDLDKLEEMILAAQNTES